MSSTTVFRLLMIVLPVVWVVIRLMPAEHSSPPIFRLSPKKVTPCRRTVNPISS
jgi:hypothetical protein